MDLSAVKFGMPAALMSAIVAAASPDPARPRAVDPAPGAVVRLRYTAAWNAPDADAVRSERGEVLALPHERLILRRTDDFPEAVWLTSGSVAGCGEPEWLFWIEAALREIPAASPPPPATEVPGFPSGPARFRDACARPPAEGPAVDTMEAGDAPERRLTPGPGTPPGEAWIRDVGKGRELRIRLPDGGRWVVRLEP